MARAEKLNRPEPPEPLIGPGNTYATITDRLTEIILTPFSRTPKMWFAGLGVSLILLMIFLYSLGYLFITGVGIWGINIPVGWGFDIINFVWWIGIGHAGTLISAILLLFRQEWRMSINRAAEAMTLFAVACAGLYPIIHLGRPWLGYWLLPYPSSLGMWPQFRSPLVWDVFAVSTYATVSLLFWYVGLIPDLATMRDRAQNKAAKIAYGIFALGWRGSANHWQRYELSSLVLAALSTPLVVSVHSIVSLDFAVSVIPGWHVTVFPPYFVAGAVFAGFAMVLVLMIPIRKFYRLEDYITMQHLDVMAKVMLATGLVVCYGYLMEAFIAWYSAVEYEQYMLVNRLFGPYGYTYWLLILCNGIIPQLMWFKRFRRNIPVLFVVSLVVNIGMWLERFVIIVTSLHRDFVPSSWAQFTPTIWDILTYGGSFGLFFTLFILFIRVLPMINIYEMRHLLHKEQHHGPAGHSEAAGHEPTPGTTAARGD
jgi:molybdopterin-containing oxidoreductase family membrane subunit